MSRIERSALVPYPQRDMYGLVNDVRSYPSFLPGVVDSDIVCMDAPELAQAKLMQASLTLSQGPFKETFTTRNRLYPYERIELELMDGPFQRLSGQWLFEALAPSATKVSLVLEFEFKHTLTQWTFAKVFEKVAHQLVDGFCQEARRRF